MSNTIWEKIRNRSSRNLRDAGLILGSSNVSIRLRSFGHPHTVKNCLVQSSEHDIDCHGEEAEKLRGRLPDRLEVCRPFREGRVENLDACRLLLSKVLKDSKHRVLMGPRLFVGVGSHLSKLEKRTIKEVAKAAGARKVDLISCAVLNVVGAGRDPNLHKGHMVVDLGAEGGEISVVSSGRVQQSRTVLAFGTRMAQAISDAVREKLQIEISPEQAEELKIELVRLGEVSLARTLEVFGRDTVSGLPCSRQVSEELVREAVTPLLQELAEEVRQVLRSLPSGFVHDIAETKVLLVGGLARIPGLGPYLSDFIRVEVVQPEEPHLVAQQGLDQLLQDPDLRKSLLDRQRGKRTSLVREGRRTEKLAGLLAVSLLLVASYFPAEKVGGEAVWEAWTGSIAPVLAVFDPPSQAAESAEYRTRLAEERRRVAQLAQENRKLRDSSRLEETPPSWAGPSLVAQVVARTPGSWNDSIMLNAGSADGVRQGMAVTSEGGLLGRVERVTESTSNVKLLGQDSGKFGGMIERTGTKGVVQPEKGDRLLLTYLDPNDGVKLGDTVKTNGLDQEYPAGVPIGKVVRIKRDKGKSYLVAELEPAAELDQVENVLLMSEERI